MQGFEKRAVNQINLRMSKNILLNVLSVLSMILLLDYNY